MVNDLQDTAIRAAKSFPDIPTDVDFNDPEVLYRSGDKNAARKALDQLYKTMPLDYVVDDIGPGSCISQQFGVHCELAVLRRLVRAIATGELIASH